ncbi:hypothetical protein GCM10011608_31230 [Micromonospora sonchi]|uniref:DUF4345 domain-containing protein n=1 Tax=Micromonospora sonchi TaxID=1763543 RepID=A0A917TYA2_9ACTN|nr:DUF6220 domain-containing protein [Micromonospora sonchi]GGM44254.1 hypothetical protein GCM10011608_31230 [Micromonospora sonchi]
MRKVFAGLAALLLLVVVAQFFFAASGAVGSAPPEESYRPHHALGYVIFLLPVVMVLVAAVARVPWRLIGLPALVAGLTALEVLIAKLARASGDTVGPLIFGLHAVTGLAVLGVAWAIVRQVPMYGPAPAFNRRRPARR